MIREAELNLQYRVDDATVAIFEDLFGGCVFDEIDKVEIVIPEFEDLEQPLYGPNDFEYKMKRVTGKNFYWTYSVWDLANHIVRYTFKRVEHHCEYTNPEALMPSKYNMLTGR